MKRLNASITISFHWFWNHKTLLYLEVFPQFFFYHTMNHFTQLKEFYKKKKFCPFDGILKIGP